MTFRIPVAILAASLTWALAFMGTVLLTPMDASGQVQRGVARQFFLYGNLDLTYERDWFKAGSGGGTVHQDYFQSNLKVGLLGYVLDPRIIRFDVSTTLRVNETSTPGGDYTSIGANVLVTFLDSLPPRLLRYWRYIPNPIQIRYATFSEPYRYTNYGFSASYGMPQVLRQLRLSEEAKPFLPFPTTNVDYDHYSYKFGDFAYDNDFLNLRSTMQGEHYFYNFRYEHQVQSGSLDLKRDLVELRPDYLFLDPKTGGLLQVLNVARYQKLNDAKEFLLQSNPYWSKRMGPMGRDSLTLSGSLNYLGVDTGGGNSTAFSGAAEGMYTKVLSQRLTNQATLSGSYQNTETDDLYRAAVQDRVYIVLSRVFDANFSALVGVNQSKMEYGAQGQISTKTKVRTSLTYTFAQTAPAGSTITAQGATLYAAGPIWRSLGFDSQMSYTTSRVSGEDIIGSSDNDTTLFSANFYWRLPRTYFTVGSNYTVLKTRGHGFGVDQDTESKVLSFNGAVTQILSRSLFVSLFSLWSKNQDGDRYLQVMPQLTFTRGQSAFNVIYTYLNNETRFSPGITEHRLYTTFRRAFGRMLRF